MESVNYRLEQSFPGYKSIESTEAWNKLKEKYPLGTAIRGTVVLQEDFGIFIDIGEGFPCLILLTKLWDSHFNRHINGKDDFPPIGKNVIGVIYVYGDEQRQIGVTQLEKEEWMGGDW